MHTVLYYFDAFEGFFPSSSLSYKDTLACLVTALSSELMLKKIISPDSSVLFRVPSFGVIVYRQPLFSPGFSSFDVAIIKSCVQQGRRGSRV